MGTQGSFPGGKAARP